MAELPTIRRLLIERLQAEAPATRRTLERVPQERWPWAPHERSMPMGRLAGWLATMLSAVPGVLAADGADVQAGWLGIAPRPTAAEQLVPAFDRAVDAAVGALERAPDAALAGLWTLRSAGRPLEAPQPRYRVLVGFFLPDHIHHRAQLGVYLRLCDIPVPAVYVRSADEPGPA